MKMSSAVATLVALMGLLASQQACAQAYRVGRGIQMIPGASRPSTELGRRTLWVDNANSLRFYNGTSDLTLSSLNSYGTIADEGSSLTQRSTLNFTGAGVSCVDNAGSSRTDCTISGGGGGTLATVYSAGASQSDSTLGLDSTRLGIRIRDNATPIAGALFSVQDSGGTSTYLSISPTQTTAGVKIAPSVDASTNLGDSTHHWNVAYATQVVSSSTTLALSGSGAVTTLSDFRPSSDAVRALGTSSYRWLSIYQGNDSVGTTVGTAGLTVENATAATVGAQKYSPAIVLSGAGWKTNATAASQTVRFALQTIPVQGTAAPTGGLSIQSSINGGAWAESLNVGTAAITASVPVLPGFTTNTVTPSWTNVTYSNSWVDFSGSLHSHYHKAPDGKVTVEVRAKSGSGATATMFTLPVGYRPGENQQVIGYTGLGTVSTADLIASTGAFTPNNADPTNGTFYKIEFYAEQ